MNGSCLNLKVGNIKIENRLELLKEKFLSTKQEWALLIWKIEILSVWMQRARNLHCMEILFL